MHPLQTQLEQQALHKQRLQAAAAQVETVEQVEAESDDGEVRDHVGDAALGLRLLYRAHAHREPQRGALLGLWRGRGRCLRWWCRWQR